MRAILLLAVLLGAVPAACQRAAPADASESPAADDSSPARADSSRTAAAPSSSSAPADASVEVVDGLERTVRLPSLPRRVVSLAPSSTEILFALGAGGLLVARDEVSDYPPAALEVQNLGTAFPNVNAEVVLGLEPDLVLAGAITSPEDVFELERLGVTVYASPFATTLEDIYRDIRCIGTLTGTRAEELCDRLRARVLAVLESTRAQATRPRVFYEIDATDPGRPWTAGPGSFLDRLLDMAGGANVGRSGDRPYFQISLEELIFQDPTVIILGSSTFGGQTAADVARRPGWAGIAAVREQRIHEFDDNLVSRPGPRVVDGLERLHELFTAGEDPPP